MRFLLLLSFLFATALAWADTAALVLDDNAAPHDLTPYLEYLEDAPGTLGIADLASPANDGRFMASAALGRINFGYTSSAYWLRLRLDNRRAGPWMLELAYPTLDRVDLYYTDAGGRPAHLRSGDLLAYSQRPFPHRNLVFPLDLPAGRSLLYLRVKSEGSMTIPASLWQPEAFARATPGIYAMLALYFGSLLALGAFNLLLYFAIRDRAYLEYVLFALGMAIGIAATNGFIQEFVWPNWPVLSNLSFPLGFSIAGLFGAMFTRTFLDTAHTAPTLHKVLAGLMAVFVLSVAAHLVSYRAAAMLVSLGGLAVSVTSLSAGVLAMRRGHPGARFFLLAWTVLLVGVGVMGMRNFGWLPTNHFTVYAMQVGSTLDLLLLSFALADRINSMRGEKEAAQAESLAAKQTMLETLQRTEEELEQRVEARTRELAAANAHLVENERTLSRIARQDALTGLGNRIALEEDMVKAIARSTRLGTGVAAMLIDLDRFKPINDEHGHGIGDEVLRLIAARLRESTRKTDTVARLGGDEFVVAVEGRNVVTDAHAVAEKILARMDEVIEVRGLRLRVGASIGIAVLVGGKGDPDELLRRADQAMYLAKRQGGNRYALEGA